MNNTENESRDLECLRHTLAHLLAAAVVKIFPDAKPTIGPAIENGFYYDFAFQKPISSDDLPTIEHEMRLLLSTWEHASCRELSANEAKKIYSSNEFKQELIDDIEARGEPVTLYTWGNFEDLCRGGHVKSAKNIDPQGFALTHLAGAYWRGSEKNPMLTRIYGAAFETGKQLKEYIQRMEEAKKNDHRRIGQEQSLFFIDETVGKGLVLWLPNGTVIRDEIERMAVKMETDRGYHRVVTPHLAKKELFETSGHLPYYQESMYPPMEMDDGTYYLKGMNCPHHHIIYRHQQHSYRELPVRLAEYGTVYRNELSGTLAGLLRVRSLAMNDAHIYCRKDQIKAEFKDVLNLILEYFRIFGFHDYWFRLSRWSSKHTEKYINEPENWKFSEEVIRDVLSELGVDYVERENEAAFYGPKVDIQFTSVIGREETMSTIQLDFAAKSRFGLTYRDHDGLQNNDVFVIHRAPLSTHERFIAFLIEHYAGKWPLWLSPIQAILLPVGESHLSPSISLARTLRSRGIRAHTDESNETVGKKIRKAESQKIPYMLVIGDREADLTYLSVRKRGSRETSSSSIEDFIAMVNDKIMMRSADL